MAGLDHRGCLGGLSDLKLGVGWTGQRPRLWQTGRRQVDLFGLWFVEGCYGELEVLGEEEGRLGEEL